MRFRQQILLNKEPRKSREKTEATTSSFFPRDSWSSFNDLKPCINHTYNKRTETSITWLTIMWSSVSNAWQKRKSAKWIEKSILLSHMILHPSRCMQLMKWVKEGSVTWFIFCMWSVGTCERQNKHYVGLNVTAESAWTWDNTLKNVQWENTEHTNIDDWLCVCLLRVDVFRNIVTDQ